MKAILVINEMPSDCNHCQFADFSNGQWECNQHKGGKVGESMRMCSKPSWCPLRPLPQKKWHEEGKENECEEWYRNGWNDCLEEITGETECTTQKMDT